MSHPALTQALTIAGSDSGGGAGMQADVKVLSAHGVYALTVVTSVTAQNTKGVTAAHDVPADVVAAQLDAVFDDFEVAAVKTGMLPSAEIVTLVGSALRRARVPHVVVDPVMVSTSGRALLSPDAVDAMKQHLIPLATVVTPNVSEAERLTGLSIRSVADARQAAKALHQLGCGHVLLTGGHLSAQPATDLLYDGRFFTMYRGEWIDTPHTHGTGCALSAAVAARLALGHPLPDAVEKAKQFVAAAIRHGLAIGHGQGPVHPFYFLS